MPAKTIEQTIAEIQHPGLRRFHQLEQSYIKGNPGKDRLVLDGNHRALPKWIDYSDRHVGTRPWVLKRLLADPDKRATMTVCCEFPEWFDVEYVPPAARHGLEAAE